MQCKSYFNRFLLFCFTIAGLVHFSSAQSSLSIEQIMQGTKFIGQSPSGISWSADSRSVRFNWNPEMEDLSDAYKCNISDLSVQKMTHEEQAQWINRYVFNKSRNLITYANNGDLYLAEVDGNNRLRITNTIGTERNPDFVDEDQKILYQSGDNFFTWDINTGIIEQLTNFRKGDKKKEKPLKDHETWLADEQMDLMQVLSEREEINEKRDERRESFMEDRPDPIYLGKNTIRAQKLSPDMRFVSYTLVKSPESRSTKVPHFVTEDAYLDIRNARTKVGSPQSTFEFYIYDLQADSTYKFDTKQIEGIFDKPEFLRDYHTEGEYEEKYENERAVSIFGPIYNEETGDAIIVVRAHDNKDRWILALDMETGSARLLDRQHDEAWIGGPGISGWNFTAGNLDWIDKDHFYFQSEASGYSHLYKMNFNTGKKVQLTNGNWEVRNAWLNRDKNLFYMITNEVEPGQQQFYQMNIDGTNKKKLSNQVGGYQIFMSPNEKEILALYSAQNQPWELYKINPESGTEQRITSSTTEAFERYDWRKPGLVSFKARDGAEVPARLYKNQETAKGGPAVIFVHGAGYLQNAHKWWSSYYREYMFHNFLVDQGYTVLDIDYRASDGYGRDWRTAIYRHMGGWDLNDQIDGAKYLVEEHGIDPDRIGIYGGSYGGFITLMALFTSPGTFQCGAALRSVTDWAHYNHGYTSNILNTPVEDPEAFRKSSPIYFAEHLEDQLLILHGMVDSNVQFQDVVRLAQRLIELGKDNWEFAVFPVEGHGFIESSSWTDEYKRIFNLFENHLK